MALFSEKAIAEAVLHAAHKLGYAELRPPQELAIQKFVAGNDVFVCLPTGSGKSLCYCLLPATFDQLRSSQAPSIVVVVSPLIALMKDQVRAMTERKVCAVYAGNIEEGSSDSKKVLLGEYQLIFISPEALLKDDRWRDLLLSPIYYKNLVALVVDEAHCVKNWYDIVMLLYIFKSLYNSIITGVILFAKRFLNWARYEVSFQRPYK